MNISLTSLLYNRLFVKWQIIQSVAIAIRLLPLSLSVWVLDSSGCWGWPTGVEYDQWAIGLTTSTVTHWAGKLPLNSHRCKRFQLMPSCIAYQIKTITSLKFNDNPKIINKMNNSIETLHKRIASSSHKLMLMSDYLTPFYLPIHTIISFSIWVEWKIH